MFNIKSLLAALVLASAMALSACGSSGPPPMPFSSIEVPSATGSGGLRVESWLPWSVQGSVVYDGPYKGYKVEGPDYHSFLKSKFSPTELNDFYTSKLTPAGWTAGKATTYLTKAGFFETGQPWVKGNQVIYLATYQAVSPDSYVLAVYLLTK